MHDQGSAEHDHNGHREGELQGFVNSVFAPRAVVVGENGNQAVVEAEDRHEEETLKFEVYAEDCRSRCGKGSEDHIHAIGHDRADGHHQDGRNTDRVDAPDRISIGTKDALPAQVNVTVELQIHEKTQNGGDTLAEDCCVGGACYAEPGESEEAEDHDRVEDDVDDGAGRLADHTQLCASCGLQHSLEGHLEEETEGETGHDGEIGVAVCDDLRCGCVRAASQLN